LQYFEWVIAMIWQKTWQLLKEDESILSESVVTKCSGFHLVFKATGTTDVGYGIYDLVCTRRI